jgi:hypothetical protein
MRLTLCALLAVCSLVASVVAHCVGGSLSVSLYCAEVASNGPDTEVWMHTGQCQCCGHIVFGRTCSVQHTNSWCLCGAF